MAAAHRRGAAALGARPPTAIAALAERRQQAAPFLATDLAREESALADSARLLVERVGALRHVGSTGERLPLVLDEPFIGLDAGDTVRLLETVRRLAAFHQVLLVTGNDEVDGVGHPPGPPVSWRSCARGSAPVTPPGRHATPRPDRSQRPAARPHPLDDAAATPSASSSVNAPS